MSDSSAIARTPSEVVHRNNKLTLLHYMPQKKDPLRTPVLCGPAAAHGLAAPVNRAIYAALKPYVDGSQSKAA